MTLLNDMPQARPAPSPVRWLRSAADGQDHAVDVYEDGEALGVGRDPAALCGATVTPSPMSSPPGSRCTLCLARIALDLRHDEFNQQQLSPSWWQRAWQRLFPPTGRHALRVDAEPEPRWPRRDPDAPSGHRDPSVVPEGGSPPAD